MCFRHMIFVPMSDNNKNETKSVHEENKPQSLATNKSCDETISPIFKKSTFEKETKKVLATKENKCDTCDSTFLTKTQLKVHKLSKPYKCKICNAGFWGKDDRNKHLPIHEEKKRCPVCDISLTGSFALERHVSVVHEGKKPYKCEICSANFAQKNQMLRHTESIHDGQKALKCSFCKGNFSKNQQLQRHIAAVHDDKKIKLATTQSQENSENTMNWLETSIVPKDQNFQKDDFIVRINDFKNDEAPIWRFDGIDMLQRFNISGKDENGDSLFKSTNLFSGYMTSNRHR